MARLGAARLRVLPDPARPYAALRDDLARLDWQWADEAQTLPLLPGEPEWVRWTHPSGAALTYEFLPPVGLRWIVAEGPPDVLAPIGDLPALRTPDIAALLASDQAELVLRGLFAVRAARALALLSQVGALRAHHDPTVRALAADVQDGLPAEVLTESTERLRALRRQDPGRSVLLAMMPVQDRVQVLRWIGHDHRDVTPGTLEALRTGLTDDDDEVRVTAALVAAILGAEQVASLVQGVRAVPALADPLARARDALAAGVRLAVDEDDRLLCALTRPLPGTPPPRDLPRHLVERDGVVRLRRTGLPAILVPAVAHRLTGGVVVPAPFVLTQAPVDRATAVTLGVVPPDPRLDPAGPVLATASQAIDLARRVGDAEGVQVDLPSALQWEAALRGPDGRRFSAGNVAAATTLSPWGALDVPGIRERVADGAMDTTDLVAAHAAPDEPLPVRVALRFPL